MSRINRQQQWAAMRELGRFSLKDLRGALPGAVPLRTLASYCQALTQAGFLGFEQGTYWILCNPGWEAPRVDAQGRELPETGQQRLWRALRVLKKFSVAELAATASLEQAPVALTAAQDYCRRLARAGYLLRLAPRTFGLAAWANSGPLAPQIHRNKRVWDPNLQRYQGGKP